jgi:hypothetical protein
MPFRDAMSEFNLASSFLRQQQAMTVGVGWLVGWLVGSVDEGGLQHHHQETRNSLEVVSHSSEVQESVF